MHARDEDDDHDDKVLGSAKRQRLNVDTTPADGNTSKRNIAKPLFKALPTPAKSSQVDADDSVGKSQF